MPALRTNAGEVVPATDPTNEALFELRRLSGLSWEQLARLFGVSRRALHFWASGKPMTHSNEEHLHRMLGVLRAIDRGSIAANRVALMEHADAAQPTIAALLAAREYERAVSLAPRMSSAARMARTPARPDELVGALHDSVHHVRGPSRPARSMKVDRRK
ncbi:MAG: helix-turn-helix domain-containing protein [Kofleriaceae bacterium]